MMIQNLWLAIVLGFGMSQAHAVDFSGHWTGSGTMTQKDPFTGAHTSPCSLVDIQLEHLTDSLTIRHYHAICGQIDSDWGPSKMEIRGTKVYEGDEETGTLEGDTLLTDESGSGTDYAFNLRLKTPEAGKTPVLESYYGVRNAVGVIVIEGNLQPLTR